MFVLAISKNAIWRRKNYEKYLLQPEASKFVLGFTILYKIIIAYSLSLAAALLLLPINNILIEVLMVGVV